MSNQEPGLEFDGSTVEGRLAEMAYLDSLSDDEFNRWEPGHRYVTRNPAETPAQRTAMLERLADAEQRLAEFRSTDALLDYLAEAFDVLEIVDHGLRRLRPPPPTRGQGEPQVDGEWSPFLPDWFWLML